MKRRKFITLLGVAAVAAPLAARAQQPERMRRLGVLSNGEENAPQAKARQDAFRKGLRPTCAIAASRRSTMPARFTFIRAATIARTTVRRRRPGRR